MTRGVGVGGATESVAVAVAGAAVGGAVGAGTEIVFGAGVSVGRGAIVGGGIGVAVGKGMGSPWRADAVWGAWSPGGREPAWRWR